MSQPFWHKADYEVDTDENSCNTDGSWSENEDFVETWTKNKSIKNMMNANNIILWLMKEMKLKRVNI